jgi:hypothetical protein
MGRVTQRVDPADVGDLFEHPPRAALAFDAGGGAEPVPACYRRLAGRHFVGVARGALPAGGATGRAVLLLDDGRWWFELRAVTLRGRLAPAPPPPGASPELDWLELGPERQVAWSYATLHEEEGA